VLAAAIVLAITAVAHSVLGELLILGKIDPRVGFPRFLRSDVLAAQTIRATWHLPSILGAAIVAILVHEPRDPFVIDAVLATLVACAVEIAIATRLRHPGWLAFTIASVLVFLDR